MTNQAISNHIRSTLIVIKFNVTVRLWCIPVLCLIPPLSSNGAQFAQSLNAILEQYHICLTDTWYIEILKHKRNSSNQTLPGST